MLPALFISHGSPLTVADTEGATAQQLRDLAASLPKPRALVVASAHWLTAAPQLGSHPRPPTVHDFSGFPTALYAIRYPAPGAPELAARVLTMLRQAGFAASLDPAHGLDHGLWTPLQLMYPQADIPVLPLSIQPQLGPHHHWALGQTLAPLLAQGVLVIGSGNITHNLGDLRHHAAAPQPAPYVSAFTDWIETKLAQGDHETLLDYRRQAPFGRQAHPTDEHLLPLYVALGAAGNGTRSQRFDAGIDANVLAMDIYRLQPDALPIAISH